MDRIREAIARARVEQEKITPADATPGAPSAPSVQDSLRPAQNAALKAAATVANAPRDGAGESVSNPSSFRYLPANIENFATHRIISNEQDPTLSAYRVLRTKILQRMQENNWHSLAVVSPSASAGKTVTAINLAISLSSKGSIRPTLVDLDFYRPSVSRYFGFEDAPSILDYFEEKSSLDAVTIKTDIENLNVIPNERVTRRGAEHLTSDKFDALVNTAVHQYGSQVVIFDMSPLLGCDDTIAVLPKVDCVLLVAASGGTRASDLKETVRLVPSEKVVGTILNKAPSSMMANPYY